MKKLILFFLLLISFSGFSQRVQFPETAGIGYYRGGSTILHWIPSDTASVPAYLNSLNHFARKGSSLYYWNGTVWTAIGGGSVSTPTWQQTLTAGSTLTTNNIVDADGNDFELSGAGSLTLSSTSGTTIEATNGNLKFPFLTNLSSQNRLLGINNSTNQVGNITLGTGLSLSSGVLSNTGVTSTPTWQQTLTAGSARTANVSSTGSDTYDFTFDGSIFYVKGTVGSGTTAASYANAQMFFYPRKAAFRAGSAASGEWDDANIGASSAAFGANNTVSGTRAMSWGVGNTVSGTNATAWGQGNISSNTRATAIGLSNTSSGIGSMSWGVTNQATGGVSTAWGNSNVASGTFYATAWGSQNTASGTISTAWGEHNFAIGELSTVWGIDSYVHGEYGTAWGEGIKGKGFTNTSIGTFNDSTDAADNDAYNVANRVFEIGIGTADDARANAMTVLFSGNVGIGTVTPAKVFHTVGTVRLASLGSASSDTTTYKPLGIDGNGDVFPMTHWPGGGGGGYTNLTQFVAQNNWKTFYSDGSGDVQELTIGAANKFLMSSGTSSVPSWEDITESKIVLADNATNNSSTSNHGFLKKLDNNAYNFMNGAGNWAEPIRQNIRAYNLLGGAILAEPIGYSLVNINSGGTMSDQELRFVAVYIPQAMTITGVKWYQSTQGNYTANNYNGVGLYSYSGGTLTQVAASTDDGNIWKGSSGSWQSKAFSSTYSASAGIYYIGFLWCRSAQTTAPAIGAMASPAANAVLTADFTNNAKLTATLSSQTALPSPTRSMTGMFPSTTMYYMSLY